MFGGKNGSEKNVWEKRLATIEHLTWLMSGLASLNIMPLLWGRQISAAFAHKQFNDWGGGIGRNRFGLLCIVRQTTRLRERPA